MNSVEALLDAIAPGVRIVVAPGYYNLSDYVEDTWAQEGESWNDAHTYVRLQEAYDGVEVVIQNADNLSIVGESDNAADTEIVTDPRYATVLLFHNCQNLYLSSMTIGHTELGDCMGDVLYFEHCPNTMISNMDLYGCGMYGISAFGYVGEFLICDTTIRDCSYGSIYFFQCEGDVIFQNCTLTGSLGGGYYEPGDPSTLSFYSCTFGTNETNCWYFYDNILTQDCVWSEITMYPDYSN